MRTRSSSNLSVVSPPNLSTSNPKRRNRRRSKQPFILEEYSIDTMADQRTMAELLRAPTEGLEKDNPHDHIRAARRWLEKEPPHSIVTWEDLISKFINEFFPSSRTTNLRNEISNFQQRFDESFHEAWDRYKDLIRACPHHGFTELHQLASVKAVEEICVTCGGAHPYYQCLATGGNTFPELRDNIQGYVAAAAVNYNQGNSIYRPPGSGSLPSNIVANPKGKLKAITTRSGIVLDGPFVPIPPPFINPEEDERVEETLTDQDLAEYTIKKLPEKLGDPGKFLIPCGFNELKYKALADLGDSINLMPLSVWKKLGLPELISTCMTLELANRAICTLTGIARDVFVPIGKFTFPADFVTIDYESDPRVPLILGRPFLRTARALIDVHGEEMILRDDDERLTLNMRHDTSSYSNQPRKESINLINVFNDSNKAFLEDLFSTNQPSSNSTFSSHPELTSLEVKDDTFNPERGNVLPEKLLDLHPPLHVNLLSGSTNYSYSPSHLIEEFADELAIITFPSEYDDDLQIDIESNLKEIEYLLHHDPIKDIDSILNDSIDQGNFADLNDNLVDSMPEMFTDEHALDYSSPLLFDEYDDDLFEVDFDTENVYDDTLDSKGEKIKESKLLIDELDLPCDFLLLSEYDSILSEDFSKVDALPSTNNKDKVFKPGILVQENLSEIITRVA
nr:reverse transcriptase domain-containing protein [Tanacetum cinerariifolium]